MLSDYIEEAIKLLENNKKEEYEKLVRELESIGMDKATFEILLKEELEKEDK